jgi:hypothetical protein
MSKSPSEGTTTPRRVLRATFQVLLVYVLAWHVSFLLMFLSRGDSVDFQLYVSYLPFIVQPGFEIPTFIQFGAVLLTGLYFLVSFLAKRVLRAVGWFT